MEFQNVFLKIELRCYKFIEFWYRLCVCSVQRNVCISVLFLVVFRYLYGKFINILPYEIGVDS